MTSITIRKLYADGTSDVLRSNGAEHNREDVASLTKIALVLSLLEKAHDGTLQRYGWLEDAGKAGVSELMRQEDFSEFWRGNETRYNSFVNIGKRSYNLPSYELAYKYGGPKADIATEMDAQGRVPAKILEPIAEGDEPYGGRVGDAVRWMNESAQNAFALDTNFTTPHGHTGGRDFKDTIITWPYAASLDDAIANHYSTADNMALIAARFVSKFPDEFEEAFGRSGEHPLRSVMDDYINTTYTGTQGRWVVRGAKTGTGGGYFTGRGDENSTLLPSKRNERYNSQEGRFHGLLVAEEVVDGKPTANYLIFSVTGVESDSLGRSQLRDTLLSQLMRATWTRNGAKSAPENNPLIYVAGDQVLPAKEVATSFTPIEMCEATNIDAPNSTPPLPDMQRLVVPCR